MTPKEHHITRIATEIFALLDESSINVPATFLGNAEIHSPQEGPHGEVELTVIFKLEL